MSASKVEADIGKEEERGGKGATLEEETEWEAPQVRRRECESQQMRRRGREWEAQQVRRTQGERERAKHSTERAGSSLGARVYQVEKAAKQVFDEGDKDGSGTIDGYEMFMLMQVLCLLCATASFHPAQVSVATRE